MKNFLKIFVLLVLTTPLLVLAQAKTFQELPGISGGSSTQDYIHALYTLSISLAAILVVLKLMYAGVNYMTTDLIGSKQKAKDDIKGALLGLLIILGAVTILNTINPNLLQLNFLRNADSVVAKGRPKITENTTFTTTVNKYTEATEKAAACGGIVKKINDGNFTVICPGKEPAPDPKLKQQMDGWPVNLTNFVDYSESIKNCEELGGNPSGEERGLNNYIVHCNK